jgi:hypothetical protein
MNIVNKSNNNSIVIRNYLIRGKLNKILARSKGKIYMTKGGGGYLDETSSVPSMFFRTIDQAQLYPGCVRM